MPVWCQDEAGPYQAIPQLGASWQPVGEPARLPHEYVRGGTAKLLTLFRPATGEVRAKGVTSAPNVVLHPWLQAELTAILATLPPLPAGERPAAAQWATWLGHPPREPLPPLRLILIWDNLAGHTSWAMVQWLFQHGVMPLYTPLSGSWLNMAESVQRIIVGRALAGEHPRSQGCNTTLGALVTPLARTSPVAGRNSVSSLAVPPRTYSCGSRAGSPTSCHLAPAWGMAW
ncbi:MAG TPA: transposase [Chloroflexota bacterium]|nr:transposase [Chloroflexota bacterium]